MPFEVVCPCGTAARGNRQARHQVVVCAGCGRKVFVLPLSPFISETSLSGRPVVPTSPGVRKLNPWRLPLVASGLTILLVGATLAFLLPRLTWTTIAPKSAPTIADRLQAGRGALAQGKFQLAVEELEAAWSAQAAHPEKMSLTERRQLGQLRRQAALLADLLSESLEDVLHHAADVLPDEEEWRREFARRYRGKAVVFDADCAPDHAHKYRLGYTVFAGERPAAIELADVHLLRLLPLEKPQRLLIGLRLASAGLEAEGMWVIRFEPDSAVLLTDLGAAAASCARPVEDLEEVVHRQENWLKVIP